MIAKGGCSDCSDEELRELIKFVPKVGIKFNE